MIDTAMFIFCLVVVLIIGIAIGYLIGLRKAEPKFLRITRKYWPYLDIYGRIVSSERFNEEEKTLLGIMIDDFVKDNP